MASACTRQPCRPTAVRSAHRKAAVWVLLGLGGWECAARWRRASSSCSTWPHTGAGAWVSSVCSRDRGLPWAAGRCLGAMGTRDSWGPSTSVSAARARGAAGLKARGAPPPAARAGGLACGLPPLLVLPPPLLLAPPPPPLLSPGSFMFLARQASHRSKSHSMHLWEWSPRAAWQWSQERVLGFEEVCQRACLCSLVCSAPPDCTGRGTCVASRQSLHRSNSHLAHLYVSSSLPSLQRSQLRSPSWQAVRVRMWGCFLLAALTGSSPPLPPASTPVAPCTHCGSPGPA